MDTRSAIRELEARAARHAPDRYPVQHGTAQLLLGVALANANELERAETALLLAVRLLEPLAAERAKALNALGAVLRGRGQLREAAEAFEEAEGVFEAEGLALEQGAAAFNLGLVRREAGADAAAVEALERARRLLHRGRVPEQAAAAARELGASLLALGRVDEAAELLEESLVEAERAGRPLELGATANVLGLARLAREDAAGAVGAFRAAAGAHPRGVRPGEHAMAKANLALAHERLGDGPRARLAARQALGIAAAPAPVRAQAASLLERLPPAGGDLLRVLDDEPDERLQPLVREELARVAESGESERRRDAAAWVAGLLDRPARSAALAEAWVGALLELPPEQLGSVVRDTMEAVGEHPPAEVSRLRDGLRSAAARFPLPQMSRIEAAFGQAAAEAGVPWT